MADSYYGNAQFQTLITQRNHDDKFVTESILVSGELDLGLADIIEGDILTGNTATLRRHYKRFARGNADYKPIIHNGVSGGPGFPYHGVIPDTEHTFYGLVPIKDDYSTFTNGTSVGGYHSLPDGNYRKEMSIDILDKLNMDALEMSRTILEPESPGTIGSPEFADYEKEYNSNPDLQTQYGSLAGYQRVLMHDHNEQVSGVGDVTDVYVGIFATGSSLSEVNVVALYHTMANLFPKITFNNLITFDVPEIGNVPYVYQFQSGTFLATNFWNGWSHVIRTGIVKNQFDGTTVKRYKAKSNWRYEEAPNSQPSINDGDPIYQILQENILETNNWTTTGPAGLGMLEIQVQLPPINGVDVYGEIRVWDYGTLHTNIAGNGVDLVMMKTIMGGGKLHPTATGVTITSPDTVTINNGDTFVQTITSDNPAAIYGFYLPPDGSGASPDAQFFTIDQITGNMTLNAPADYSTQNVYYVEILAQDVAGNVFGTQSLTVSVTDPGGVPQPPPHTNPGINDKVKGFGLIFFPLEYKASRKIPLFKRERFLRESTLLGLYTITEVNLEWYEKTWFKVVMFIVAIVIAVLFPPSGYAGLGALLSAEAVVTAAATIAITQVILQGVLSAIDNPYVAFIVQVAAMLMVGQMSGKLNLSNLKLADVAMIGMEASGTAMKKYWAAEIKKLKEEYEDFAEQMNKYEKEITICEKYIENQKLSSSEEKLVSGIINFLENLKISREYVKQARNAIVKHDSKDAVKFLKKGNGFLISLLQIASGQLTNLKDYEIVEKLICSEISKMEFLRAFLLVSLGRVNTAIDSLERAALFATIIHNHQTCLTLNYVKALILLFHGLYKNAIMAYNFTEELAEIYNDEKLKLKCAIGKSIALYIQGEDVATAMAIMEEISGINMEENFLDAIIVFSELGDYFLALGHSQLAANLYNEALEVSIDYKLKIRSDILIEKLKRAYIATVLNGYSTEDIMIDRLDVLLDKAYSVKDVEKYNEQIKKRQEIIKFSRFMFFHL